MLEKVYINTQLRKLALGMALCGAAFFVSGLLELRLEQTYAVQPQIGEGQLRIFNGQPCGFKLETTIPNHPEIKLEPNSAWTEKHILLKDNNQTLATFQYNATSYGSECKSISFNGEVQIKSKESISYFLTIANKLVQYTDSPMRSTTVLPLIRILMSGEGDNGLATKEVAFQNSNDGMNETNLKFKSDLKSMHEVDEGIYFAWIDGIRIGAAELKQGGTYTIVINRISSNDYTMVVHTVVEPVSIHILWQIPQYVIMTAGEIMFSVTGLEFSFTQAPSSMKSVLQAFWLLTVTFGNIFVVIIAKIKLFDTQSGEFFLYAGLMALNIILFIFLAMKYKYRDIIEDIENDEHSNRNANAINMNTPVNQTFVIDTLGPTTKAIAAGANPRTSISSNIDDENVDSSPKCLKQRSANGKNGVDNYGYSDI